MVRRYKKKDLVRNWKQEDLVKALAEIKQGSISVRAAAKKYNIPKSTMQDYAKGILYLFYKYNLVIGGYTYDVFVINDQSNFNCITYSSIISHIFSSTNKCCIWTSICMHELNSTL